MEDVSFARARCAPISTRRNRACVQLIAIAALVVSLAVALTAVSLGIARAGAPVSHSILH